MTCSHYRIKRENLSLQNYLARSEKLDNGVDETMKNSLTKFLPYLLLTTTLVITPMHSASSATVCDVDFDSRSDLIVIRPDSHVWYALPSSTQCLTPFNALPTNHGGCSVQWGLPGDIAIPADYSGKGVMSPAVYRPSTNQFFIRYGSGLPDYVHSLHHRPDDKPATDFTSYRASLKHLQGSFIRTYDGGTGRTGAIFVGRPDDTFASYPLTTRTLKDHTAVAYKRDVAGQPVTSFKIIGEQGVSTADFLEPHSEYLMYGNTDPKTFYYMGSYIQSNEYIRFNQGIWRITERMNPTVTKTVAWGLSGDKPVLLDVDGDSLLDLGVVRNNWPHNGLTTFFFKTSTGQSPGVEWSSTPGGYYLQWGLVNDEIACGSEPLQDKS